MKTARQCIKLLRTTPGSVSFGHHLGHVEPEVYPLGFEPGEMYRQNGSSWPRMWQLVCRDTDSNCKCKTMMDDRREPTAFRGDGGGKELMKLTTVRE